MCIPASSGETRGMPAAAPDAEALDASIVRRKNGSRNGQEDAERRSRARHAAAERER